MYTISPDEIKHFTRDSAGHLSWADCYASVSGCRPGPPGGGYAATVNAAGTWLYTAAASAPGTGAVARYKIGPGGALTFAGCNGRLLTATCAPTGPPGAVDGAISVAVTSDGTQLYVAAQLGNVISHFTVDKGGNLTFAGCTGDHPGCAPTSPSWALDGADSATLSWTGADLYAVSTSGQAVSHLKVDAAGNPVFISCIADHPGCAATAPAGTLAIADGVAVSGDGTSLYATSAGASSVSHFTIAPLF